MKFIASGIHSPDRWLSFVGGFGDAAGFVLSKTFTGHVTGSLVLGAIAMAVGMVANTAYGEVERGAIFRCE